MFGVWTTGQAFDPEYEAKRKAARQATEETDSGKEKNAEQQTSKKNAPGRKEQSSAGKTVTEATLSVSQQPAADNKAESQPVGDADDERPDRSQQVARPPEKLVDFAALRSQVTMEQALDALGLRLGLRGGRGSQYRGACPIHGEDPGSRKRSFSVNLTKGVFRCFHADCGVEGNVLDLWSAVRKLSLREAALEMMETFGLACAARNNREEEPVKEPVAQSR